MSLDPDIISFYARTPEEDRLLSGVSQLEALRTRAIIARHAPAAPGIVCDVGGGAGAYSFWLADCGYTVHLLDASERLVGEARRRNEAAANRASSIEAGDARELPFADQSADIVVMLGPLYHLTDPRDRALAIGEAARVLRPGGVLFAAAISRWASALDGLARDLYVDPAFAKIVEQDLRDGQHRNSPEHREYFTTAYFHTPAELHAELSRPPLEVQQVYGLEGPNCMLADFEERWADPRKRADMIRVAEQLESDPAVVGVSPHLLGVANKRR